MFSSCQPSLLQIHQVCALQFATKDEVRIILWFIIQKAFFVCFKKERLHFLKINKGLVFTVDKVSAAKSKHQQEKNTFVYSGYVPLNQVIASCSKLHSALLLLPLVGLQTETSSALNLFQLRGEVQPAEGFRTCLLLGFHLKMFTNATAGSTTGRKEI